MQVISTDLGETWTMTFVCVRCLTCAQASASDLQADEFKTSGYHFAGNAVCARRLYLECPSCQKLHFLSVDDCATVPFLLAQAAHPHRSTSDIRSHDSPEMSASTTAQR